MALEEPDPIHYGDVGTELVVQITKDGAPRDVSTATFKYIQFRRPNGSLVEKPAVFDTTGIDGMVKYVTEEGFLDMTGWWGLMAYVSVGGKWHTKAGAFEVLPVYGPLH